MKIAAVISEFNPFHNGHGHLIRTLRAKIGDAAVVAIMSGDFVQRGDVAVIGKYARAEAAVMCGCDLVLELPAPWCFSGAEFFARGGVSIADSLGCVDHLVFGAECDNFDALKCASSRLISAEFASELQRMRDAHPEANAAALRADAYRALYGETSLFDGSNNLLALEYLRALDRLQSEIEPITIKRIGGAYGSDELSAICSATAIRKAIGEGSGVGEFMPEPSARILDREIMARRTFRLSNLDTAVCAMLRTITPQRLREFMEISGGMENRLIRAAASERTIDGIVQAAAERRYSESRLRRAILAALLGVRMSDAEALPRFTALLAANERGRQILAIARKKASIAILSKPSAHHALTPEAVEQYRLHARAESIAELACDGTPEKRRAILTETADCDII